ncbi:MAG: OmpH family outer membrane protein [Bacteroidales bacterium]|nr:OmpH family outer membrane protein [Bacteroidales bacterium]MDE6831785.1 OmpH family outer membrane protein [Muribaculaceae bacterium]
MKKSTLSLMAGAMILAATSACSGSKDIQTDGSSNAAVAHDTNISIRYYNLDSVMNKYHLCADFNEIMIAKSNDIEKESAAKQKELEAHDKALQRKQQNIESKLKNGGYLTEQSYNADVQAVQQDAAEFQRKYEQAQRYIANLQQEAANLGMQQQQQFVDSLNSFLADYNAQHHFDAILVKSNGDYFNPALDITDEIVNGLNSRYTKVSAQ